MGSLEDLEILSYEVR